MGKFIEYNRVEATKYATKWALSRNPAYKDYEKWGGDCTNYVSQCVHAGGIPFDHEGNNILKQWYWYSDMNRTPSWTIDTGHTKNPILHSSMPAIPFVSA